MEINSYSVFMAVVLSSIASIISYFLFKNQEYIKKIGALSILLIYLACILRMLLPIKLPFTFVFHDYSFSTDFYYWFGLKERNILGFTLTIEKILIIIWIIGIIINLIILIIRYFRINYKLSCIVSSINPHDNIILSDIKNELKRKRSCNISIIRAKHVDTPFAFGIIKPRIFLPDLKYDDDILHCILMHEYIHCINYDTILKLMILFFCCIFWWNPIVYLLKHLINKTLEIKCDLNVVANTENIERYLNSILTVIKGNDTVLSEINKSEIIERFRIIADNSLITNTLNYNLRKTIFLIIIVFLASYTIQIQPTYFSPENPVDIVVWHYYDGEQRDIFEKYVDEFNKSEGAQKGVRVKVAYFDTISEIQVATTNPKRSKTSYLTLPNIIASDTDNAFEVNRYVALADLEPYFTEKELSEFVDEYINEGFQLDNKGLKLLPIVKSTEVMYLNRTEWNKFANATGVDKTDLTSLEGVAEIAKQYYNWSGGKSFFGRDEAADLANITCKQYDNDIFKIDGRNIEVTIDKNIIKKLWDVYIIPSVNGYFNSEGFSTEPQNIVSMKTGTIVSCVDQSSSAASMPKEVTIKEGESYPVEIEVLDAPSFQDGKACASHTGPGMSVIDSGKKYVEASVSFLKWLTETERNANMAAELRYLPVKKEANNVDYMRNIIEAYNLSEIEKEALYIGINIDCQVTLKV